MIYTMSQSDFMDFWPENRKDQFSCDAKAALFNYFIDYETDTDQQMEFDPISICCDFTEYNNATEAASEYFGFEGMTYDPEDGHELETAEEVEQKALEFLEDNTTVLSLENGGVVIQNF